METVVLANHIKRTVTGPMWHGPALDDLLKDVTPELAAARPIAGAHSIWELVLHVTAWAEIAAARLRGETIGDPAADEDWPPVGATDQAAWDEALQRLRDSHRPLAHAVASSGRWRAAREDRGPGVLAVEPAARRHRARHVPRRPDRAPQEEREALSRQ